MIASPAVRGRSKIQDAVTVAAYVVGVTMAAVVVGASLHWLSGTVGRVPAISVAVVAVLIAVAGVLAPEVVPSSGWRVPRSWGALPRPIHAGLFGSAVGSGLATAIPSPAYYVLLMWAFTSGSWVAAVLPFLALAIGQASMFVAAAVVARETAARVDFVAVARQRARLLAAAEVVLLIMLAASVAG